MGIRLPRRHQDGLLVRRRRRASSATTPGTSTTATTRTTRSARRSPIPGACTTCTATWPNGRSTSMFPTSTSSSPARSTKNPWAIPTKLYPQAVRGGSWDDDPAALRSAARRGSDKDWKQQDPQIPQSIWYFTDALFLGFRVVRPLDEPTADGESQSLGRRRQRVDAMQRDRAPSTNIATTLNHGEPTMSDPSATAASRPIAASRRDFLKSSTAAVVGGALGRQPVDRRAARTPPATTRSRSR